MNQAMSDKVRKSLLGDGATSRYILYAIGEIALVVIGILIALQINNWNEWRKDRLEERVLLLDLKNNLEQNVDILSESIRELQGWNNDADSIVSYIFNKAPYHPSMDAKFHRVRLSTFINLTFSSYERLKSSGFSIVQSDQLKNEIINLFDAVYTYMKDRIEQVRIADSDFQTFLKHRFMTSSRLELTPVNYTDLLDDHYFKSSINHSRNVREWHIELMNQSLKETQRVLQQVNKELRVDE